MKALKLIALFCLLAQAAWADYFVNSGSFNCPSGTPPVAQTISGVGFLPKAVMLFSTKNTADGTVVNYFINIGFATLNTQEGAISAVFQDAVASTSARRGSSNADTMTGPGGDIGGTDLAADFTSFNADGFVLNWTGVINGVDIHWIAWGGSDITNVKAGTFQLSTSVTPQTITGVGFLGEFGIFIHNNLNVDDSSNTTLYAGLGAAISSSEQWAQSWMASNAVGTSVAVGTQISTDCIALNTNFGIVYRSSFSSWTADGFIINNSTFAGSSIRVHYLIFQGGQYKLGAFNQKISSGTQIVPSIGFEPKGVLLSSYNHVTNTSQQNHARISLGVGINSTNRRSIWSGASNATVSNSVADQASSQTRAITLRTEGTPTTNAQADFVSNNADGTFTLDWTTADATAREILYMAFAGEPAAATGIINLLSLQNRQRRQ